MWTWLKDGLFACINVFYQWTGDWGLSIIIITLLFRALVYPLSVKQNKSSYAMRKVQPMLQAIQVKYADDPQRQQQEIRKLYSEYKANPLMGCLPALIMMPIFLILYQVLLQYVPEGASFFNIVPELTWSPKVAWDQGIAFSIPYIVLMILFALSTFLPMIMQGNTKDKQNLIMSAIMAVFMLWISWSAPGGVLIFWDVSSIIGAVQMWAMQSKLRSDDEAAEAKKIHVEPVQVNVERRVKKPKPKKKGK
jgi:YidC/Oxa1 family membrane protein insertase